MSDAGSSLPPPSRAGFGNFVAPAVSPLFRGSPGCAALPITAAVHPEKQGSTRAPACGVQRLAEPERAFEVTTCWKSRESRDEEKFERLDHSAAVTEIVRGNRWAGAPIGTREGACAPLEFRFRRSLEESSLFARRRRIIPVFPGVAPASGPAAAGASRRSPEGTPPIQTQHHPALPAKGPAPGETPAPIRDPRMPLREPPTPT